MNMLSRLLIITLSFSLISCGFQLRGQSDSAQYGALSELNLICPNTTNWQLCQTLRQQLKLNDINLSASAPIELRVSPIEQDSRVLSLQENAAAAEYGLGSKIRYQIVKAKTLDVILERSISLKHSYRHESSELLAKERERNDLQVELSQQLAQEIFRQFEVLNAKGLLASDQEQ